MIRRRRPVREIPFSFDSFLDVVANVVGIIIRLILVVWVGARSYTSLVQTQPPPRISRPAAGTKPIPEDPLREELARHRRELELARARLLEQLPQLRQVQAWETEARDELASLEARRQEVESRKSALEREQAGRQARARAAALSLEELRRQSKRLLEEIRALQKQPRVTHTLRYHTPVSVPVEAEEVMFELRRGRVTYIDTAALLGEIRQGLEDKAKLLKTQWRVEDVAGPVGDFRVRYVVERQKDLFDNLPGEAPPTAPRGFRYGLTEWQVEPVTPDRGEPEMAAVAEGSRFRQVVDALDPKQTVVTLWVYPDSFALYRRLRDYLYERDVVVAGRPLPEGVPITCSRMGTRSRGQ